MAGLTDAYELPALKAIFGDGKTADFPATYHVMLFTVMPNDAGTGGTEVAGAGYGRVAVANTNANWDVTAVPVKNKNNVTFPAATANYAAQVVGWGLATLAAAGAIVFTAQLAGPATFLVGEVPIFTPGDLAVGAD